uniref:Protocadherin gamma-A1 n=1 Tax=Schistosoma haematobium TaxID=6185 RepID=A0A094ZTY6_SCHHA
MMQYHDHCYPIIFIMIILLLKSFISSSQIPIMIYNLADETPTGSLIGNIAENLSFNSIRNHTYLFITSMKFQYINDYIKITSSGDIITLRHIDRDNTNDICGPLNCCPLLVCQIEANIILTKQWNTHWKHDSNQVNHSFMKDHRTTDEDEEKLRRNSIKLNESNEQQTMVHLYIRINDANDNPPHYENIDDREIYATFYAIDGGDPSLTGSLSIIVRLLDMNDNPPMIEQSTKAEQYITLPENTTLDNKPFYMVNATDADSGEKSRLIYSFSQLANSLIPIKFHIDSINGAIIIREPLDYEVYSERQFLLPIVVKDSGSPPLSCTTSISIQTKDINDNIPTLMIQENITIPEGHIFTKPIIRFYIKDEDEVSHGKILCKPTPLESNHLQDKELLAGQDYLRLHPVADTMQYASLSIDCYDLADIDLFNFSLQHFQQKDLLKYLYQFRITVAIADQNDNIPIFKQSKYYIKIPEHLSDGSYITEMKAHDLDKGEYGQLTYQLKSITYNYIDDHDPDHDKEDPDHSKYSRHPQEYEQPFEIDPFNGIITVLHNHLLDREQIEHFYLNILAIDKGNLTTHTQLIIQLIDINDHLPILYNNNNINIDFQENQKINTFIGFIHLIDLDKDSKHSMIHLLLDNNQSITNQSIDNQSVDNQYNHYIKIIPDRNFHYKQINHNELINEYELKAILINHLIIDREKINKFFYQIITYNTDNNMNNIKSINSITYTFTINILDENDNIPICIYPIYNSIIGDYDPDHHLDPDPDHSIMIYTNTLIYTFVIQIKGYDPDHGLNGTILYQLNSLTNGSQYFYLNESNGKLYTNWIIDSPYDSTMINMDTNPSYDPPIEGIYHIKISLKDMGIPSLSSNETQFFIKIHSFNPSIINNQSTIHSNQKTMTFWLSNHPQQNQFLWILLIISMILLIIIISSIVIWIQSYCKQKFNHPIIISTTTTTTTTTKNHHQSLKKPYLISCLSTNKKYQYSSKINNHNNQSIWPDTNIIHQSINDHLNVNTTTSSDTTINTTYNDPFDYTNHLHTNPICSLPFPYDTGNHSNNNNTNDYYYHNNNQLIGQKYTSLNASNLSINHLNSSMNGTLTNDHLNHDVYIQSSLHRTIGNSIVYSTYTNSYLSPIYDHSYYDDQCK